MQTRKQKHETILISSVVSSRQLGKYLVANRLEIGVASLLVFVFNFFFCCPRKWPEG